MRAVAWFSLFVMALYSLGCGGDYEVAQGKTKFMPSSGEFEYSGTSDPADQVVAERVETQPVVEPQQDPVPDPDNTVTTPRTDPEQTSNDPEPEPEKTPEPDDKDDWDPEWTDNEDPAVEGCLEMFPAICNKVTDCSDELPALGLFGGLCAPLFDGISPMLEMGCEQLAEVLAGAGGPLGDIGAMGGGAVQTMITKLLTGCIEGFTCDLEYIVALGEKLGAVVQLFSGGGSGGGDFTAALPQLLELAEMCGGIGNLLPF